MLDTCVIPLAGSGSTFGSVDPRKALSPSPCNSSYDPSDDEGRPPRLIEAFGETDASSRASSNDAPDKELSSEKKVKKKRKTKHQNRTISVDTLPQRIELIDSSSVKVVTNAPVVNDEIFDWEQHCIFKARCYAETLPAAVGAVLFTAIEAYENPPTPPPEIPEDCRWGWIDGIQVELEGSTPPGSPPCSLPDFDYLEEEEEPTEDQTVEVRLLAALQRETQLMNKISEMEQQLEDQERDHKVVLEKHQKDNKLRYGKTHIDVPLSTQGPCATVLLGCEAVDIPLKTREGDMLLSRPPKKTVDPIEFTTMQLREYERSLYISTLFGIVLWLPMYFMFSKSLPQKAGCQKGSGINFAGCAVVMLLSGIAVFASGGSQATAFILMGCSVLFGVMGLQLFQRGRIKKSRFLGKEDYHKAENRLHRKSKR